MSTNRNGKPPLPMRPAGTAGRVFGVLMERMNTGAYRKALKIMAPRDGQCFLEIGFGTGKLVELLLNAAPDVRVAGIDPTETMVEVARARKAVERAGARADLRVGTASTLPWEDAHFDGACALHSFQFWPAPDRDLEEIRRVLKPGGTLLLVLRDHSNGAHSWLPNPASRSGNEVEATLALLEAAGFRETREEGAAGSSRILAALRP